MIMSCLKELKSLATLAFVLAFLFSATLTSCGNKDKAEDNTEHAGDEHPSGDTSEHPTN